MQWLNYHHLLYFWVVAREGSIARATKELRLAEPTISGQINRLEEVLGEKLFERSGRRLVLTEHGRLAFDYADEIFSIGQEFTQVWSGNAGTRPARLRIGISSALPKVLVNKILSPALQGKPPVRILCHSNSRPERLIEQLGSHSLDLILSDTPAPPGKARIFNHLLGACGTIVVGSPALARRLRKGFPHSLDGAPFLVSGIRSVRRQHLQQWFSEQDVSPAIVAEIDDNSLLMELGKAGVGVFAAPSILERDIRTRYAVRVIGALPEVQQQFFAITAARRVSHPTVLAFLQAIQERSLTTLSVQAASSR